MGFRYPQPDNEDGFEQVCLRFYRKHWKNESLKLYAKRGEEQDGVDIFDPLMLKPVRAVQCKHHEATKTIQPAEIKDEVRKAENSQFTIEHYVIATTAKKSRNAQNAVAELNRRPDKKFTVDIHFWEDLCDYATELGKIAAELIFYGENILAGTALAAQGGTAAAVITVAEFEVPDGADVYSTIEALLNERKLDLARHELDKLPDPVLATSLPIEVRYKLLRLRGKLDLESGEYASASNFFLQAYGVDPKSSQAKQNHVLALSLRGESQKAYAVAKEYIAAGVTTAIMVLRLIDNITSREQLAECSPYFERFSKTDEGVNIALAHKYLLFGDFTLAYETAKIALSIAQGSPQAHFVAALSIHNYAVHGERRERRTNLEVAVEHYNAAETAARQQRFPNLLPDVLVNRAAARMLLGNTIEAAADYRTAVASAVRPSVYAERAVGFFLQEEDFTAAHALQELLDQTTPEARYLSLVIEYHSGPPAGRSACILKMKELAALSWDRAVECRFQCVQWALDLGDDALATDCVPIAFVKQSPFQAHTMLAWIACSRKDVTTAKSEAALALESSLQGAHPQEIRILARMLVNLKDDSSAIGLLEQVARPGVLDDEMIALISCAQRLDRHDLLLRLCRELRTAGVADERLQMLEVKLLNQYSPEEALELAGEFSQNSSKPWYFVAFKNMVSVRLHRLEDLNLDLSQLPTAAQLPLEDVNLVLLPYVTMGMYNEALTFLYEHRRVHFEDESAHGRYLMFLLKYGNRTNLREPPEVINVDCAVLLDVRGSEGRWVILENQRPLASRGEFATDTPLGRSLIGRSVGDTFELPGNLVQPEMATVREIQTKYVRAAQDGFQHFPERFPGTTVLQKVHVGEGEEFDPSPVVENLRQRREYVEQSLEIYRVNAVPLFFFANRIGINELEAIKSLASLPKGQVKCSQGIAGDFERRVTDGMHENSVVLSISAIVTLSLVDGWKYLDQSKSYLVSQLTSELVDSWIFEHAESQPDEGGHVSVDDSNLLVFRENTAEAHANLLGELNAIRRAIDDYCTLASSFAMSELDPEKRQQFTEFFGLHNVEAMTLAKTHNALLWCDDAILGCIAKTEIGVPTIWTQLALRCFVSSGTLRLDDFDVVTAKLVSWNYVTIVWNASTMLAAAAESQWKADSWPYRECVKVVSTLELVTADKVRITVEFLRLLRRSSCAVLRQSELMQSLFTAFDDAACIRWIMARVDVIFGIDVPSAVFVRFELQEWLREAENKPPQIFKLDS